MSWVCPNCSNSNDETQSKCFVCGMDRPDICEEDFKEDSEEGKIVFSDFEAFTESIKKLFRVHSPKKKTTDIREERSHKESKPRPEKKIKASKEKKPTKLLFMKENFTKPWPEHKIKFDISVIRDKGYVRSEQKCLGGVNGYCFYKEDGSNQFLRVEMVLIQKMAHKE